MPNVQEHLNDNKDSLEKKTGSLSETEKGKLEGIKHDDTVINNAKKTTLDIKAKDGTNLKITAENLIKEISRGVSLAEGTNYKQKLENADVKFNGKKLDNTQFGRGSEIMAFLQVAAGGNLTPDGKFGASTAKAFSELLTNTTTNTPEKNPSFEKVGLKELTTYNFYSDFVSVYGDKIAKTYKDVLGLFKADGTFTNCTNTNGNIVIRYKSQEEQSKNRQSISFKASDIQKPDLNIDNKKLLELVKTKIDNNEAKIKKESMNESIGDGIEDVKVLSFTPFMQEYIRSQGWITNGEIDFKLGIGNGSGMEVKGDKLYVTFPGKGSKGANLVVSYLLKDMQTNNKFDQKKFVANLTKTMIPLAQTWKKDQLTGSYNYLAKTRATGLKNISVVESHIKSYEGLKTNVTKYSKEGVVLDQAVTKGIDTNITNLKNQKKYIEMKNSDESKVKGFEEFLNKRTPKTAGEQMSFQNEINSKKGEYKTFRDDFNKRAGSYAKISYTDWSNFNDRLKKIDKTYGYN